MMLRANLTIIGAKGKKPNAKAQQAAKATLKGVRALRHFEIASSSRDTTGSCEEGAENQTLHHLSPAEDFDHVASAEISSEVRPP